MAGLTVAAEGWTIAEACADFAEAGIPVTPKQLGGIIGLLPGFMAIDEARKPPGSKGGRGYLRYTIGDLQDLVSYLQRRGWLVPRP